MFPGLVAYTFQLFKNTFRLSIYRGYIQHDCAHSPAITVTKIRSNFALAHDTTYGRAMGYFSWFIQRMISSIYRGRIVLWGWCDRTKIWSYSYYQNYCYYTYGMHNYHSYSISQEICTRFCCALLCCGYAIVHNEFTWSIYPYSLGLLYWHWGNR